MIRGWFTGEPWTTSQAPQQEKSPRELRRAQSCDAVFAAAERAQAPNSSTCAARCSLHFGWCFTFKKKI